MRAIQQRIRFFSASACLGIMISVLILACSIFSPEFQTEMLLIVAVMASGFMAGLWMREYRKLKSEGCLYHVGDRVQHLAGLKFYEKYDKTGDKFIPCSACGTLAI